MLDFKPPKDSQLVIGLSHILMPFILQYHLHDTELEIIADGLERFRQLDGKRVVICPNHSNSEDPELMFAFGARAGQSFNYMAAREVFEWNHGWRGKFFQMLGCYSVVRGAPDREAFRTTRDLIVKNKKKVVIFPEGEVSHQNDTLMPLETGVAQMAMWALEDLKKQDLGIPVYMLPVALKYTFRQEVHHQLETAMWRLEERLSIKSSASDCLYARLRAVAVRIIEAMEVEYGVKPPKDCDSNTRIDHMRSAILKNIAAYLQVNLPPEESQLGWVRILRNALDDFIYHEDEEFSEYEKRIHEERCQKIMRFYSDLDRVVRFIAIYDGYVRDHLTQERFSDVLDRFEKEVFGKVYNRGPRKVMLDVGRPINLLDYYADYKANKKGTLHKINDEVAAQLTTMLETLESKRTPIFVN